MCPPLNSNFVVTDRQTHKPTKYCNPLPTRARVNNIIRASLEDVYCSNGGIGICVGVDWSHDYCWISYNSMMIWVIQQWAPGFNLEFCSRGENAKFGGVRGGRWFLTTCIHVYWLLTKQFSTFTCYNADAAVLNSLVSHEQLTFGTKKQKN